MLQFEGSMLNGVVRGEWHKVPYTYTTEIGSTYGFSSD